MKVISYDNLKDFMKLLKTRFTAPRAVADAAGSGAMPGCAGEP